MHPPGRVRKRGRPVRTRGNAVSKPSSRLKVATAFQICDEPDLPRAPSEQLLRARARRPEVPRSEVREEAEVGRGFVRRLADDRHVQLATDDARDLAERHALLADG